MLRLANFLLIVDLVAWLETKKHLEVVSTIHASKTVESASDLSFTLAADVNAEYHVGNFTEQRDKIARSHRLLIITKETVIDDTILDAAK